MYKYIIIIGCLFLVGCSVSNNESVEVSNTEIPVGNVQTCKVNEYCSFTQEEAYEIALNSTCAQEGKIKDNCTCNENSQTYWFDMEVEGHEGCNPACVVESVTGQAEINWRCTGLILPEE